jgi:hypothetical protein
MAKSPPAALEAGHVPLLLDAHRRDEAVDDLVHHVARIVLMVSETSPHQQVVALLVDDLALIVGDVVVLEQLLADIEVAALDLALGVLDGLGDPWVLDGLALLHAQGLHQVLDAVRGEDAHQVVFRDR